jgi:hypothetical protein
LKPKLTYIFKDSVITAKKIKHVFITEANWLMLLWEIIAVSSEKPINTLWTKCIVTDWKDRWYI